MGRIPEETIEAIRDRTDIVDLVGRYVALKQAGRSFKGLCPFHHEKTPSFHVNPQLRIFHCFGCTAGGNVFAFLMRHDNLTFPEAVRSLARDCGIEVPEDRSDAEAGIGRRLRAACALAERFYRDALRSSDGAAARAYLARRGLDDDQIARFGLGYAPDRWDALVRALGAAGIPAELGVRAGLLGEGQRGHYDRLRGRVIFPIRDVRGDAIAFGGRALPGADGQAPEPKYLNTPESPLFRKREALYGLPDALEPIRRAGRAVVVEGYFDRIALARADIGEALATCGTALTPDHARQLCRRTQEVVLLFDGDAAGQRAVERSLRLLLPEGLRVRAVELPAGEDPDTFLEQHGAEALRRLVADARPALDGVIRRAVEHGCTTAWEKADVVAAVTPLLVLLPDPVERGETARQLSFAAGVPVAEVEAAVRRERAQLAGNPVSGVGSSARSSGRASSPSSIRSDEICSDEIQERIASGPRRETTEARWARVLARTLVHFPALASSIDPDEVATLVPAPWDRVLPALVDALADRSDADLGALAEQLGDDAGAELCAVAVEAAPEGDAEAAIAAMRDTFRRLRQRRLAEQDRQLTQRLRLAGSDAERHAILEEKHRIQQRKRLEPDATPGRVARL
ncbi:DNA primase [Myxococcota bacterium]|nr:DNA primase [Myxococcota bacterium]MCZ7617580.1 DNA primase [Myxococcota bacterium]